MSKEQEVFVLAEHALQTTINKITDDQWPLDADSIPHWGDGPVTLKDVVNRHVYDDIWIPETLAGKTIDEVGEKFEGDLLGEDPKTVFASVADTAISHVQALEADELDRMVHLTYGDYSTREYLKHITTFRGFRAYTIAKFINSDASLPPKLVDGLWDLVVPEIDAWRTLGVFGPAINVPGDADKQTKLLGLTGFLLP